MIAWLGKSIQRKMAASFVVIFLATYGLTALVVFTSVSQITRQTEADTLSQIANQKLGQITASLNALGTNLSAWARLEVMNDIFSGDIDTRIFRTLQQLRTQYDLNGQIYVFDDKGQFVASSGDQATRRPGNQAGTAAALGTRRKYSKIYRQARQSSAVSARRCFASRVYCGTFF